MEIIVKGPPTEDTWRLKPYMGKTFELSVHSGCLLWGRGAVILLSLQAKMLQQLHAGNSGIVNVKESARSYFWWPGMDKQNQANSYTLFSLSQNQKQLAISSPSSMGITTRAIAARPHELCKTIGR